MGHSTTLWKWLPLLTVSGVVFLLVYPVLSPLVAFAGAHLSIATRGLLLALAILGVAILSRRV